MAGTQPRPVMSRRAVVLGLPAAASLPVGGGAFASLVASSSSLPAELPSDRVARLARELSDTLNEVGGRKSFVAIYPSNYSDDPIRHGDIADALNAAGTVSAGLMQAIVSHCAASGAAVEAAKQADTIALGHQASRAERVRIEDACDVERDLFRAVCRYPTHNDPERHEKASYLLGFCDGDELEREHVIAILESMTMAANVVGGDVAANRLDRRA
jgi:hypothetical protein